MNSWVRILSQGLSLFSNHLHLSHGRRVMTVAACAMALVMVGLFTGPAFDYIYNQTTPPTSPNYRELPTPRPTTLDQTTGHVLSAQLSRADQFQYLKQVMNNWDLDCFSQARAELQTYKHQPGAYDRYVASLWECAHTGRLSH